MATFENRGPQDESDAPTFSEPTSEKTAEIAETGYDGVIAETGTDDTPDIDDKAPDLSPETPLDRIQKTIDAINEDPDRRRYSSSESVQYDGGGSGHYSHSFWLPKKDEQGNEPEKPGLLRTTAYLDEKGFTSAEGGSVMDRYHYRTGSGVVTMAQEGFAPVMSAIGIDTSCTVDNAYWNRNCTLRISFGSSAETVNRANKILEASGETLRFSLLPPGRYDGTTFIREMAEGRYPISTEFKTPAKESAVTELGSHDVLQHAPAILAMAGTRALQIVQRRAQELLDGSAYRKIGAMDERQERMALGWFMGSIDNTLNVINFSSLLQGDPEARRKMHHALDLRGEDVMPYIQEILDNIRTPMSATNWYCRSNTHSPKC